MDFLKRAAELRELYQSEMYGFWREGERVGYELAESGAETIDFFGVRPAEGAKKLTVHVSLGDKETSWSLPVYLPDKEKVPMPDGGYPFIIAMHGFPGMQYALEHGFAVFTNNSSLVASDDTKHTGSFYDLYPYTEDPASQTGVLMAWAWGLAKIYDAVLGVAGDAGTSSGGVVSGDAGTSSGGVVSGGLAEVLGLNPSLSIATGVSRYGKATAVLGAFDHRFKVIMPACSGAGGLALYRYVSEGLTFDFSAVTGAAIDMLGRPVEEIPLAEGEPNPLKHYTYGQNEPLSCLQSDAERGWFNDKFLSYKTPEELPVEQYELVGLAAVEPCKSAGLAAVEPCKSAGLAAVEPCKSAGLTAVNESGVSEPESLSSSIPENISSMKDRAYYIVGALTCEDWVNAPAMWECYKEAEKIYDSLGLKDSLICNFHKTGHAVIDEDIEKLIPYFRKRFCGIDCEVDMNALQTSAFAGQEKGIS